MTPGLSLLVLATPLVFAVLIALVPARAGRVIWVLGSAVGLVACALQAAQVVARGPIEALGNQIRVDGLGALMALLVAFLAFGCSLHALASMSGTHASGHAGPPHSERRMRMFGALFMVLEFTLFWVAMTNNILLLWVALEATTLASALLVSFHWDMRALEAGYKYLLLLTVGITAAFFGCVLLYASAAPLLGSDSALLISNLQQVADRLPPNLVLTALLLLLIGFGTKAGLAPFHPWVADAHAEAPAVMSAFLSSVIIKVPFIGILRVWSVFGPRYPELNQILLVLGAFTMVVGAVLAVTQDDLKRLLAYSSVSQVGYIAAALGLGSQFGFYAAVFFVISHALAKGLLFLCTGSVVYSAHGIRSLAALGGLGRRMPLTATCALVGALSLCGMPPFGGFVAKVQVAFAAADARQWVVLGIALATSLVTMAYMTLMVQRVFAGAPRTAELEAPDVREVPLPMRVAMALLAGAVVVLGLQPQWLDPLLRALPGV